MMMMMMYFLYCNINPAAGRPNNSLPVIDPLGAEMERVPRDKMRDMIEMMMMMVMG
jgi:hypothetical protein